VEGSGELRGKWKREKQPHPVNPPALPPWDNSLTPQNPYKLRLKHPNTRREGLWSHESETGRKTRKTPPTRNPLRKT